ncbi:hypothetical protein SAMN05421752_11711 [Natronorubrum thiooxidans]|uniref:Uncharacterized protein n=1 Tax=Natronorubrum thiooxidans TaxID=308853 RepID=A0A1N7GX21_9EURY|nr:hypothetical protein SAMN05421752_11711 [Natronorubrum thiooxidans]
MTRRLRRLEPLDPETGHRNCPEHCTPTSLTVQETVPNYLDRYNTATRSIPGETMRYYCKIFTETKTVGMMIGIVRIAPLMTTKGATS